MNRRHIFSGIIAGVAGVVAATAGATRAKAVMPVAPDKSKVVYHLSDADKVSFVLGNIRNHIDGVGGPEKVTIALVVHGPALKAFRAATANPDITRRTAEFSKQGVRFNACGNTMKSQNITLKDLLPGFVNAEQGGVVRIAELQEQGYVYLRP